jgi:hypothetical protein
MRIKSAGWKSQGTEDRRDARAETGSRKGYEAGLVEGLDREVIFKAGDLEEPVVRV